MRRLSFAILIFLFSATARAKTVVFWADGFPAQGSAPVSKPVLQSALGSDVLFADIGALKTASTWSDASLLVLPYGSAVPVDAWAEISRFVRSGGNLLVIGGQPFRVPVAQENGRFVTQPPSDALSREMGIQHTYETPQKDEKTFSWRLGYSFLPNIQIRANKYFVLEGRLDGLGYMLDGEGQKVAAPVVVMDHRNAWRGDDMLGSRMVMLDFEPQPGYWDSRDGIQLIRAAAEYAAQGATIFSIETQFGTIRPGQTAQTFVHLRSVQKQRRGEAQTGKAHLELLSGDEVLARRELECRPEGIEEEVDFEKAVKPGFYTLRATYEDGGKPREFYQNGFWVEDTKLLHSGPVLGVSGDFLTEDGKPFFPFGTNYFSTESNGWDFSGPRNADVWDRDFADMQKHGVSFVRTGVWGGQLKFLQDPSGGVNERFLRNLEAYLLCARRHNIAVNFNFFAFEPQGTLSQGEAVIAMLPGSNPYLDSATVRAEQNYMLSVVNRFKDVPYLCWDLINEPSFSNPHRLWRTVPNGDPAELAAWHKWLAQRYGSIGNLASAWNTAADRLKSFDAAPLPSDSDLMPDFEHGAGDQVRAFDYNLFAQDMFSGWVQTMVGAIRATGSKQLIDVGQDEGGVTSRPLNQFYGGAGVSFTTNHTYRQNTALLWDSIAAKRPGEPSIVGETGYQPVTLPNGDWRYDEITGFGLIERKWAAGLAGGTSGALSWDWDRETYFGIERSDGSAKTWVNMMRDMGGFVRQAASYATGFIQPEVAIVLPQSLQLSALNFLAIEAQRNSVRALYGYARGSAYAVGENQLNLLGSPKLIIVPSPWLMSDAAWTAIKSRVENGATLLISGRFDEDEHFRESDRAVQAGIDYVPGLLMDMYDKVAWPGGEAVLSYPGNMTDVLPRAYDRDGSTFVAKDCGKGKILFSALPLELNNNLQAVGEIYKYALHSAGVKPTYSSQLMDPGISICPTVFPHATLYVVISDSSERRVEFRDERSGKSFSGTLAPGRAALLLAGEDGKLLATYNWK